jgi:hypothetical protein
MTTHDRILKPAKYWVVETGCDCDGYYTRGRVWEFANLNAAEAYQENQCEWSDGMGYHIIETYALLEEYCDDHNLNAKDYYNETFNNE